MVRTCVIFENYPRFYMCLKTSQKTGRRHFPFTHDLMTVTKHQEPIETHYENSHYAHIDTSDTSKVRCLQTLTPK